MELTVEIPLEVAEKIRQVAGDSDEALAEYARRAVEEKVTADAAASRSERARRVAALMEQWNAEDTADPDPDPVWEITPLSLREHPVA